RAAGRDVRVLHHAPQYDAGPGGVHHAVRPLRGSAQERRGADHHQGEILDRTTMAKAKFERTKPHVNVGTIGHVDHGKTTLTAALTKVSADKGYGTKYISYDQVAKASESQGRRDATKILTIATSHVEYETPKRHCRRRELGEEDRRAVRRARQLHPAAGARGGQAVPAPGRGRVLDHGPRHGGHGPYRSRQDQGR